MDKNARHESRCLAIQSLFSYLARDEKISLEDTFSHVLETSKNMHDDAFALELIQLAADNIAKCKVLIKAFAPEFPFEKIVPINRVILILGMVEMKHIETPPIVVINEYVELAKQFGEVKSAGFINGVLDSYRKNLGLTNIKK